MLGAPLHPITPQKQRKAKKPTEQHPAIAGLAAGENQTVVGHHRGFCGLYHINPDGEEDHTP